MATLERLYLKKVLVEFGMASAFPHEGESFSSSEKVADLAKELLKEEDLQEHSFVFCFDGSRFIGYARVGVGGRMSVGVDAKIIFPIVLLAGATGFTVVHNHPSGKARPSKKDVESIKTFAMAAYALGLNYIDDIIITKDSYFSVRDWDMMPDIRELDKKLLSSVEF